jgi:hypothetical protein
LKKQQKNYETMASKQSLQLNYEFSSPLSVIYENVLDLKKFGAFHPHMTDVKIVSDSNPKEIEYEIFEEIYLFGFIKNHPHYNATVIEVEKGKHIRYVSQVKKSMLLTIDFTFSENKENKPTKLTEKIEVTCNKIIGSLFLPILKKAHILLFEKMK